MFRPGSIAAALAAGLIAAVPAAAAAPPAAAAEAVHVEGPAEWLAGAPGPDHAARAYPQYAQRRPTEPVKFMGVATLMGRIRLGDTPFIVDVRSHQEFLSARLPNAVNIPLEEIDTRIEAFPRRGTIVLY